MSELDITAHARARMRQRGIPEQVLPYLFTFGKREYDHHGAAVVFLTRRSKEKLRTTADQSVLKRLERAMDVYAVISLEGRVVTVGHRTRRINRS